MALNSIEVEYMATSMTSYEAIWLHKLLVGLFDQELDPTVIYCDNQSCIKLSKNPLFHDRSKANRDQISLHTRHGSEGSNEAPVYSHGSTSS
jgi:hypothetical protein